MSAPVTPMEAVSASSAQVRPAVGAPAGAEAAGSSSFGRLVSQGLAEVNGQLLTSQTDMQRLAVGEVQNLHHLMIRLEESRLSFQVMLQVRNRLLEAYQDVMRMQV